MTSKPLCDSTIDDDVVYECHLPKGHKGSHEAYYYWSGDERDEDEE